MQAISSAKMHFSQVAAYSFVGVRLDLIRRCLVVDQCAVECAPHALSLLEMLCENAGRLVKRDAIFERLWPGGQEVSEAALSQTVWRLRTAMGPYAEHLITVRKLGFRIDCAVTVHDLLSATEANQAEVSKLINTTKVSTGGVDHSNMSPVPLLAHSPNDQLLADNAMNGSSGSTTNTGRQAKPITVSLLINARRRFFAAVAGVGVLLLSTVGWMQYQADWELVSKQYALLPSDVQAANPDTTKHLRAALLANDRGERAQALVMLQNIHATDRKSPLPALFIARFYSNISVPEANTWLQQARQRFTPETDIYVRLLADYFAARIAGDRWGDPLNAMLAVRPQAWALQFARAHDQVSQHELAGALEVLQKVPIATLAPEVAVEVLADRFALGDRTAESLAIGNPTIRDNDLLSNYLTARFAHARGDWPHAIEAYERARQLANDQHNDLSETKIAGYTAFAALQAGSANTESYANLAWRLCVQHKNLACAREQLGLLAFLAARAGNAQQAAVLLKTTWQAEEMAWAKPPLLFIALQNGITPPADIAEEINNIPQTPVFSGVGALLLAWQAFADGDRQLAAARLAKARQFGVEQSYHAEDAALLAHRLGESDVSCRPALPFPNPLRATACALIAYDSLASRERLATSLTY